MGRQASSERKKTYYQGGSAVKGGGGRKIIHPSKGWGSHTQLSTHHSLLQSFLKKTDLAIVIPALITPRLDYCTVLYMGLPLKRVKKLQFVQNAATRLLSGMGYRCHNHPSPERLILAAHFFWAQFRELGLTFEILNGCLGPGNFDCLPLYCIAC